jgi:hypothetical protein|tara:strand:- start:1499 stop:1852 length:354 start_codon:yes stop_codon:yes gene_type:complete
MKKYILLFILFAVYSCSSTINKPLYAKSDNVKELILLKYGKPSKVENQLEKETWIYDYSSQFKSNRTVVFDNYGKIITNKKHYKTFHMVTYLNKHGYIAIGATLLIYVITGPFPALL